MEVTEAVILVIEDAVGDAVEAMDNSSSANLSITIRARLRMMVTCIEEVLACSRKIHQFMFVNRMYIYFII